MQDIHDVTDRLPDGLEGNNIPDDFSIPPCGIEDVDRALFDKFNAEIGFVVEKEGQMHQVPVIMSGGERFAMVKRKDPIRDDNGTLILPLIAIHRTGIDQSETLSGLGRGIGQDTGDLVIRRKLSPEDRNYQRIKNALDLKNQDDVASTSHQINETRPEKNVLSTVGTRRQVGAQASRKDSGILGTDLKDNIIEIITIPYPEFFRATYEITFWTQYRQHMNALIETMMCSYDAMHNQFRIDSPKGYWFVAFVDGDLQSQDNFKDYVDTERTIQYTFNVQCTGYIVGAQHPGQRTPFRRYLSAPQVSFGVQSAPAQILAKRPAGGGTGDPTDFILSDVTQLDLRGEEIVGRNSSPDKILAEIEDPFTGKTVRRYTRVLTQNQRAGETVARLTELDNILSD